MSDRITRRRALRLAGGSVGVGLAGCTGDGDQGGNQNEGDQGGNQNGGNQDTQENQQNGAAKSTHRHGGVDVEKGNCWSCVDPYGTWELDKRIEEETGGALTIENVVESQLCSEAGCMSKVANNVVNSARCSTGNSTKFIPENHIWVLAYLFPERNPVSIPYTNFSEEAWERYWVPMAKKYGIVPMQGYQAQLRTVSIGTNASEEFDGDIRVPSDIKGLKIRRTLSRIPAQCIEAWGANPVEVAWGDTIEGLKSGLVSGLEAWNNNIVAFGMIESVGQQIINNWSAAMEFNWANVEHLKNLPDEHREVLASQSKKLTVELVQNTNEILRDRNGVQSSIYGGESDADPTEDTPYAKHGVKIQDLNDDEFEQWKENAAFMKNPDLYSQSLEQAGQILGGKQEAKNFAEWVYDYSRANHVPDSVEDFSGDQIAWWDDYLDEI